MKLIENGFEIIMETKRKDYKDSFVNIPHEYLYTLGLNQNYAADQILEIFNKYEIEFKNITDCLEVYYSNNLEYYSELLRIADSIQFPIKTIQTKREFLTRAGIDFGQRLYKNKNWNWLMIAEHRGDYVGWTIVDPLSNFGIPIEQLFFVSSFKRMNIKFEELIKSIELNQFEEMENGFLQLYEPWMNYDIYK